MRSFEGVPPNGATFSFYPTMQTQPIDFHPPVNPADSFLLPDPARLFAERAERFASLAEQHALADWLRFLGHLSRAQQQALATLPELPLPTPEQLELAARHGMPPLDPSQPPAVWRDVLSTLIKTILADAPAVLQARLGTLAAAPAAELDRLAALLFAGEPNDDEIALLPFIAAALQVVMTALAARLGSPHLHKLDVTNACPCCGSPAVASILRTAPEINNLRYLHCSLCNTEWHVTRAICTCCSSDRGVALQEASDANGKSAPVRAETCEQCKHYMKQVYQEKEPRVDPVADDLASLALDLLVDAAGYSRGGVNFFLIGAN